MKKLDLILMSICTGFTACLLALVLILVTLSTKKSSNPIELPKEESKIEYDKVEPNEVTPLKMLSVMCQIYHLDYSDMVGLIEVESHFDPEAVSYLGKQYGYGLMQVSEVGLEDYNLYHQIKFEFDELSDPILNIIVGTWIYNQNKIYLQRYGVLEVTSEYLMSAYNKGAFATFKEGLAEGYIEKIQNAKEKLAS